MKKVAKLISIISSCALLLLLMSGFYAFAGEDGIYIAGANGDATLIGKGTSMKLTASGVTPGKSVTWSVTAPDGSETDLATVQQTGALTCILTAADSYGQIKVTAIQNDGSGRKGEKIISISNENLVTVDDTDSSIIYVNSENAVWEENNNSSYYLGTGKCVVPPEDDSYSPDAPAYAEFTFVGTGIQWIGESNYYCGIAEVYLDGEKVSTADPFAAPGVYSQFINFSREGLPYGEHTIRIVAAGAKNPASTQYPGTRVLIDAFRYIPGTPASTTPAAVLIGASSVQPGASFTVGICLNNVTERAYSEDITLSYDTDIFEFETVAAEDANTAILETVAKNGTVRILAANVGGVEGESTHILDVGFRVKSGVNGVSGTISIIKAELGVMPGGRVVEAELSSKTITVEAAGTVDKTALGAAIAAAQSVYDNAVVGLDNGCYRQADKDVLQAAIASANAVYENAGAAQEDVDNATAALNAAVDAFRATVIVPLTGDIDNSIVIDVADLAIVAYYYGMESGSEGWEQAVIADIDKDGRIGIVDLAFVANRM